MSEALGQKELLRTADHVDEKEKDSLLSLFLLYTSFGELSEIQVVSLLIFFVVSCIITLMQRRYI